MNRRKVLKSTVGMSLLPTILVPDVGDSLNYEYLDSLFQSDYKTEKNFVGTLGRTYTAKFVHCRNEFTIKYNAYSFRTDTVDIYDNTVEYAFKHYLYVPQNSYEAWTLCEIARNQGLDDLITTLDRLNLETESEVEHE
jgi:hypothetical protein